MNSQPQHEFRPRLETSLRLAAAFCLLSLTATGVGAQETWAPVVTHDGVNQTIHGVTMAVPNGPVPTADPIFASWDYDTFGNPPFLFPNGFAENPVTNEWIVADTYHGRLLRFATDHHPTLPTGHYLGAINTSFGGNPTFPYGPVVDDAGTIVVADIDARAIKAFVPDGDGGYSGYQVTSFTDAITDPVNPSTAWFGSPYRVALVRSGAGMVDVAAGLGSIVVLDAGENKIQKLTLDGGLSAPSWSLLTQFGQSAEDCACSGPGIFNFPTGLSVDADGNIYVSDPNNSITVTIQVFDPGGNVLQVISEGLSTPWSLAVAPDGRLFVADTGNNRIAIFSKLDIANPSQSLQPVRARIGSPSLPLGGVFLPSGPNPPGGPGVLQEPTSIAFDRDGRLIVADTDHARFQIFRRLDLSVAAIALPQHVLDSPGATVDVMVAISLPDATASATNVVPAIPTVSFTQAGGAGTPVVNTTPSCIVTPASSPACGSLGAASLGPGERLEYTFTYDKLAGATGPAWFSVSASGFSTAGDPITSAVVQTYAVAIDGTPPANPPVITASFSAWNPPPVNGWYTSQPVLVDLEASVANPADGIVQEIEYTFGPNPPEEGDYFVCYNADDAGAPSTPSCEIPIYKSGLTTVWYRAFSSLGLYDTEVPYPLNPAFTVPGWTSMDVYLDYTEPAIGIGPESPMLHGWFNQLPAVAKAVLTDTESLIDSGEVIVTGAGGSIAFTAVPGMPVNSGLITFTSEGRVTIETTASDLAGNVATDTLELGVDVTPPVVDPPVVTSASPLVNSGGATWSKAPIRVTFAAHDSLSGFDWDATPDTECLKTVSEGQNITVSCQIQDWAGNMTLASAGPFGIDTDAPTLVTTNIIAGANMPAGHPTSAIVTFSPAVSDNVDPSPSVSCTPASGSSFPLGTTTVVCTAIDAVGNSRIGSFTVTVDDRRTQPVLTLPADFSVQGTGPAGAVATYNASASDAIDGPIAPVCEPASGSLFPLGATTVTCSATNSGLLTTSESFVVTVIDTLPPALTQANVTVIATSPAGALVTFAPKVSDIVDGTGLAVTCHHPSGSGFPIGSTPVTCSSTDAHGNAGSVTFTVDVRHSAPVCTTAIASPGELWPPNHKFVTIGVNGITNADGTPVALTISSIYQDEPTDGLGDGDTPIDGQGVGTGTAKVRSERSGTANGRVYYIGFTASTSGGSCSGTVTVGVPHDQGHGPAAVGDGPIYDSTMTPPPAVDDSKSKKKK